MGSCRTCRAPVRWVYTEKGKRMPIDPEPRDDGNLVIVGEREDEHGTAPVVRYLKKGEGDLALFDPPPRYVSHFATCPNAGAWRKGQKEAAA